MREHDDQVGHSPGCRFAHPGYGGQELRIRLRVTFKPTIRGDQQCLSCFGSEYLSSCWEGVTLWSTSFTRVVVC
jgi:hypothetical protein